MNTKKLFIGISLVLSLSSCDKLLDINPVAEIIGSEMFETAQGCEEALYGVYGTLIGNGMYGQDMSYGITEVLAQHFRNNNKEMEELPKYNYENPAVADRLSNIWGYGYQAIGYTNNIIINLERLGEDAYPLSRVYLGEAYALRAMLHFDLLRLFAPRYEGNQDKQGIPYVTIYAFTQTPFSTVDECYDKVIADFRKAQGYLMEIDESLIYPSQGGGIDKRKFLQSRQGHLNYYAVTALLARVLWSKNDLPGALAEALKVINSQKFSLLKSPDEVENMLAKSFNIKETLFGLASKNFFVTAKDVFYTNGESSGFTLMQEDIKSPFPYEDIYRRDVLANDGSDARNGWFGLIEGSAILKKCFKFVNKKTLDSDSGLTSSIEGGAVIRIPEMYYIVAEARLAGNDIDGATAAIDSVLISRGLKGLAQRQDATLTLDFIYNERQKEFFSEGVRWFDMKKRNEDIKSNAEHKVLPASDKIYRFPIPAAETNNRFQ